jgi:MFS family permease
MQVESIDPSQKISNLAFLTVLSSITAVLGLLAGGALSDRTRGAWGRRTPWLVVTASTSAVLLGLMGMSVTVAGMALVYSAVWFLTNFYQGALTAVLPDRVPEVKRGMASSVFALGGPLGILVGVNLTARVPLETGYLCLACLLVVTTAAFVALVPEGRVYADVRGASPAGSYNAKLRTTLRFFAGFKSADFTYAFCGRALIFFAFFTITGYQLYLLQDYIGSRNLPHNNPQLAISILSTIQTIAWIAAVSVAGWIADRLDRRKLFVGISSIGMAVAMLVPMMSATWTAMLVFQVLLGICFGTYWAVDLALMSLVLPDKKSNGRDMAILAVATAGPQILSPVIAGTLISLFGYEALFLFGVITSLLGGIIVFLVKAVR